MAATSADIQDRCRVVAKRIESVDPEAAALLLGYGQTLLVESCLMPRQCICACPDGLVQEWVSKARAVAAAKGYSYSQPQCICEIDRHDFDCPVHNAGEPPRE